MSDLAAKKTTRSRAACDGCRSTKQRCDGPSVVPCRRCQLYNLACIYTQPEKKAKSAKVAAASAPALVPVHAPLPSPSGFVTPVQQQPIPLPLPFPTGLHNISARLRSIESALSHLQLSTITPSRRRSSSHVPFDALMDGPDPASPHDTSNGSAAGSADSPDSPKLGPVGELQHIEEVGLKSRPAGANALAAITEAVDMLAALANAAGADEPAPSDAFDARTRAGQGGYGGPACRAGRSGDGGVYELEAWLREDGGRWSRPDVVARGVMSEEEVEGSFKIFFTHLVGHAPVFPAVPPDSLFPPGFSPSETRARSPLLYHAILYVTAYFLWPKTARGKEVYLGLERLVAELIGSLVVGGRKEDWNTDTVVGLVLFVLWKPVPFAHFLNAHDVPPARAELAAKTNVASSATLYALISFLSARLDLTATAPAAFAQAFQAASSAHASSPSTPILATPSSNTSPPPPAALAALIPAPALYALRTLLQVTLIDVHGALSHGRTPLLATPRALAQTLRCTRAFAALEAQPSDVRLAASTELYAIVLEQLSAEWYVTASAGGLWKDEWNRPIEDWWCKMEEWEDDWRERLAKAYRDGDSFAYFSNKYSTVTRIGILANVFIRWSRHRRYQALPSPAAPPPSPPSSAGLSAAPPPLPAPRLAPALSPFEWGLVERMIDLVERLFFFLSMESRADDYATNGTRRVLWPEKDERGHLPPLQIDPDMVALYRTGLDPYTCVGFTYPLILVSKICNQGVARCEMLSTSPFATNSLSNGSPDIRPPTPDAVLGTRPRPIMRGKKLHRLLELGAEFLDAIAPTKGHPAAVHASTVRVIVRAGLWGQDAHDAAANGLSVSPTTQVPAPEQDSAEARKARIKIATEAGKILQAVLQGLTPVIPPSGAIPQSKQPASSLAQLVQSTQSSQPAQISSNVPQPHAEPVPELLHPSQPPADAALNPGIRPSPTSAPLFGSSSQPPFFPVGAFPPPPPSAAPPSADSNRFSFFSTPSCPPPPPPTNGADYFAAAAVGGPIPFAAPAAAPAPSLPIPEDFSALFAASTPAYAQHPPFAPLLPTPPNFSFDPSMASAPPAPPPPPPSSTMDLDAAALDWAALEESLGIANGGLRGALLGAPHGLGVGVGLSCEGERNGYEPWSTNGTFPGI
ncbi:hypothetical protein JCM10207_000172 [Rhodosporidiobolus poonsookiae]